MNNSINNGIIFAQLKANITNIQTCLPKKTYNLYDSKDKVTCYFDISGNDFKKLFYQTNNFSMPSLTNSENILGDFSRLDEWCHSFGIGEIITEPFFFDFINEVFISWQKDLGINICDWDHLNNKRLLQELNDINHWTLNKNYEIKTSFSYTELLSELNTTKFMKGSIFQLSLCIVNPHIKIKTIQIILNFRINKDET